MYKYQSKCKFRMLTTIGDKILEIRPKQIIESSVKIDNNYLIPLNKKSDPHYKYVKKEKKPRRPKERKLESTDEKLQKRTSKYPTPKA